jgi:hypothetical protein
MKSRRAAAQHPAAWGTPVRIRAGQGTVAGLLCTTAVLGALLGLSAGCGGARDERPKAQNPVQYFRQTQANTSTPNGRILLDTVHLSGPNLLRYQTEDGSWFELRYQEDPSGGYRYFNARHVAGPLDQANRGG